MGTASANPAHLFSYSDAATRAARELQDFVRTKVAPAMLAYARHQECLIPIDGKVLTRLNAVIATDTWVRTVGQAFLEAGGGGAGGVLMADRIVVTTDSGLAAGMVKLAEQDYRTIGNYRNDPGAAHAALAHLNSLMKENGDDPEFATGLMRQLGPRGLIDLLGKLAVLGSRSGGYGEGAQAATAQRSLSSLLARATDPSSPVHLDDDWVSMLDAAAALPVKETAYGEWTGWQLLEPLLQNPSAHFSTPFLTTFGRDLLDYERKRSSHGKAPWATPMGNALPGTNLITPGDAGWDPMIGLLNALSRNPAAATFLLDPKRDKSVIEYLTAKRGWPYDYNSSHAGEIALGNALRAAAATNASDPAQQRIAAELVRVLGHDYGGKVSAPLQPALTDLLSAHIKSGHVNAAFSDAPDGETPTEFTKKYLQLVMASLAENPDQYHHLASAEIGYAGAYFGDSPSLTASSMAQLLGALAHGRINGMQGAYKAADDKHNARVDRISWVINQALGKVPTKGTAGGLGMQGVQWLADRAEKSFKQDSSQKAALKSGDLFADGQTDLMNAVEKLARKTGHGRSAGALSDEASKAYSTGYADAGS
ncbi:hypothetical protein [Streptomyces misionensis]|uniref:hypothetical protein n=1 Tax=Streptomyces misionensis TaxID=67331 RepID=UPI00396C0CB9